MKWPFDLIGLSFAFAGASVLVAFWWTGCKVARGQEFDPNLSWTVGLSSDAFPWCLSPEYLVESVSHSNLWDMANFVSAASIKRIKRLLPVGWQKNCSMPERHKTNYQSWWNAVISKIASASRLRNKLEHSFWSGPSTESKSAQHSETCFPVTAGFLLNSWWGMSCLTFPMLSWGASKDLTSLSPFSDLGAVEFQHLGAWWCLFRRQECPWYAEELCLS